jgi:hypothetical protein
MEGLRRLQPHLQSDASRWSLSSALTRAQRVRQHPTLGRQDNLRRLDSSQSGWAGWHCSPVRSQQDVPLLRSLRRSSADRSMDWGHVFKFHFCPPSSRQTLPAGHELKRDGTLIATPKVKFEDMTPALAHGRTRAQPVRQTSTIENLGDLRRIRSRLQSNVSRLNLPSALARAQFVRHHETTPPSVSRGPMSSTRKHLPNASDNTRYWKVWES